MSNNSSSSASDTLLSAHLFIQDCSSFAVGNCIFTSVTITNILLVLPLSVTILHLGHQRWRQQRRPSALTSPCDLITFHMVVLEMIYVLASVSYSIGLYIDSLKLKVVASYIILISACGQMSFHTLTCVERYLAVVHPVTYMHLGKSGRVRITHVIISCVWLLGCAEMGTMAQNDVDVIVIVYFAQQVFSVAVVSFCSLAVLRVLRRRGPGEQGGERERVDQSKKRAFNTIMAIAGALLLRFGGCLICTAIFASSHLSLDDSCAVFNLSFWFFVPGSLVLPLLFLHRAGKLQCIRNKNESGQGPK